MTPEVGAGVAADLVIRHRAAVAPFTQARHLAGSDNGHVITLEFARWREQATTSQLDLDRRREAARLVWLDLQ